MAALGLVFPFFAANAGLSVKATDTIAGYSAALRSSVGSPNATVIFSVEKPDGGTLRLEEIADETGVARSDLLGFHTKKSGKYSVAVFEKGDSEKNAPKTSFEVFPDTISSLASRVELVRDAAPADGSTPAKIRVSLRDRHGNPIPQHFVDLISSRADDRIQAVGDAPSNDFGEVIFHIFSREMGVAHFSAFDRNAGITLEERAKIVFFEPSEEATSVGGTLFSADIFGEEDDPSLGEFGPVDHFEIEFPEKVEVGSDTNYLKITAMDNQNRIAKDYTGTIILSIPDDDNATLPNEGQYRFTDRDQGVRKFDLALIFSKTGKQKIIVNDFYDGAVSPFIKGEKTIEVIDECLGASCNTDYPNPSSEYIQIKTPADGAQFGNATISLTGKAAPNTNLKVFIDDREFDEIEVDADGVFISDIQNVAEGSHSLFLREISGAEEKSKTVEFGIDTTPPTLDEISVYPSGTIDAGSTVSVTLFSEEGLDAAVLRVAGIVESFQEDAVQSGKYTASFSAPQNGGQYGISVSLTDNLKNTSAFANAAKIEVSSSGQLFPAPKNVTVDAGEGSVLVSWDLIKDDAVAGYRVFSGTNDLFLKQTAEVLAEKNSVLLKNLKNDDRIFISVSAVSEEGREGIQSNPISAVPKENARPVADPEEKRVSATPLDGKVLLSWESPEKDTAFFDIRFGITSKVYTERFLVVASKNEAVVPDLVNELNYFFTVVPVDENGIPTGEKYAEIQTSSRFSGIHSAALHDPIAHFGKIKNTEATGSSALLVFAVALLFSGLMFSLRRPHSRIILCQK